jgi:hypothetical protein
MRLTTSSLTALAVLWFAGTALAADFPQVEFTDQKLPLEEIRPNDRRVYVLLLEAKWSRPALPGVEYYVNYFFADGGRTSHRVLSDTLFAQGELRCLIQENQLILHQVAKGGQFWIVVSMNRPACNWAGEEVVSKPFEISWPMDRPIVFRPVSGPHTPPGPVDAFPPPEGVVPPQPGAPAIPPPVQKPEPPKNG